MTWKTKVLLFSVTLLSVLYGIARALVPPTVYVLVTLEDGRGAEIDTFSSTPYELRFDVELRDGLAELRLSDGLAVRCVDLNDAPDRALRMKRWTVTVPGGGKFLSFEGRPGQTVAVAAMHSDLGPAEAVVHLPHTSAVIPWGMVRVRLRLAGVPGAEPGQLDVGVAGQTPVGFSVYGSVRLSSAAAGVHLVRGSHGLGPERQAGDAGDLRCFVPSGTYGVEMDHFVGMICGNHPPELDDYARTRTLATVQSGVVGSAQIQRTLGVRLDLDLLVPGAEAEIQSELPELLRALERAVWVTYDRSQPAHEAPKGLWTGRVTLRPLAGSAPARPWFCRWEGCESMGDRRYFPLRGTIEGIEQLAPGEYELILEGGLIQTLRRVVSIPAREDIDGDAILLPLFLEPSSR